MNAPIFEFSTNQFDFLKPDFFHEFGYFLTLQEETEKDFITSEAEKKGKTVKSLSATATRESMEKMREAISVKWLTMFSEILDRRFKAAIVPYGIEYHTPIDQSGGIYSGFFFNVIMNVKDMYKVETLEGVNKELFFDFIIDEFLDRNLISDFDQKDWDSLVKLSGSLRTTEDGKENVLLMWLTYHLVTPEVVSKFNEDFTDFVEKTVEKFITFDINVEFEND
jgi:hypothetical protein